MKKTVLLFSMTLLLSISGMNLLNAQEQPKPKKDTVNMDTDAKPQFYYAVEDETGVKKEGSNTLVIAIIAGVVVIIGAAGFFLLKKKK
jgi:LPXTG-motif cell wall-anchored protein